MSSDDVMFARLLKDHREQRKLSQQKLAEKAEISTSAICLYEQGGDPPKYPKPSTAVKLAEALGLDGQEKADFLIAARPHACPDAVALLEQLGRQLNRPNLSPGVRRRMAEDLAILHEDWLRMLNPTVSVSWAVIPVAGWQARLLADDQTARLIERAATEATAAGIKRLMIVVAPTQRKELPGRIKRIPGVEEVEYVVQEKQMGFGHALAEAYRAGLQDETLAVITPDEAVAPLCLKKMIRLYMQRRAPVVAVRRMSPGPERLYGIVEGERGENGVIAVTQLEEKPRNSPDAAWVLLGRYVLPPHVFKVLKDMPENPRGGNIELTDALQAMIKKGQAIDAYVHEGSFRSLSPKLDGLLKALDDLNRSPRRR